MVTNDKWSYHGNVPVIDHSQFKQSHCRETKQQEINPQRKSIYNSGHTIRIMPKDSITTVKCDNKPLCYMTNLILVVGKISHT